MTKVKITLVEKITIFLSMFAIIISAFTLYYTIGDHTERLSYDIKESKFEVVIDKKNDEGKQYYTFFTPASNKIYIYNDSSNPITIKSVEKYLKSDDDEYSDANKIEEIDPEKWLKKIKFDPGDYVSVWITDFSFLADKESRSYITDKLNEYKDNNPDKWNSKVEKNDLYYVEGIDEYLLDYAKESKKDKKVSYIITTTKGKTLTINLDYPKLDEKAL